MASETKGGTKILAAFFDEGVCTPLFSQGEGAVRVAFGLVGGQGVYAVCQNGEPVAAADVELCCKTMALAAQTGNPVVTFYNSKGAKLTEGLAGLAAAQKLNAAAAKLSGVVPQIAVVTGVCGASSALAATNADLCVLAKDAELFLTSPSLSADKMEGMTSAESAVESGVVALLAEDAEQAVRETAKLVMLLPANNLSAPAGFEYAPPAATLDTGKYTGTGATLALADEGSAVELYAGFGDGVVTSLATISGCVVGIVATNGPDSMLGSYCVARTARFVRMCDAFSIPVVTLIHTGGIVNSSVQDAAGNLRLAARLAGTYADATTARVCVLTGRAIGTAYTALGSADLTIAVDGCVVAPAAPGAVVTVLYKDEIAASAASIEVETAALVKKYEAEVAGADAALQAGLADMKAEAATLRNTVVAALDILSTKRTQRLPKKHGNTAL